LSALSRLDRKFSTKAIGTPVVDLAALQSWHQYSQATAPVWDWETARMDGKLHRFGYWGSRVLVLVVTIQEPAATNKAPV